MVPLSLQNGKCFASFPSRQHTRLYFPRGRLLWPSADYQTSDGAHKRAFPYSHIEESTIHRLRRSTLSLQKRKRVTCFSLAKLLHSCCRWASAHQSYFPLFQHIAINYPPSDKSDGPPFSPERSFVLQVSPCVSFSVLIFYKRIFRCTLPFQIASKSDRKNSCRFFVVLKEAIRLLLRANYKEFSKLKNGSSCPYALASSLATSRLSRCWIALKISLMHSGMPHSLDLSRRS